MQNTEQIIREEAKVQEGGVLEVFWFRGRISKVQRPLIFSEE
ncbi:MAG TPA: hypothetical protein VK175_18170 [Leadbetterella sp.]|nr:hypothetical protein [Leadbetterella sp.]